MPQSCRRRSRRSQATAPSNASLEPFLGRFAGGQRPYRQERSCTEQRVRALSAAPSGSAHICRSLGALARLQASPRLPGIDRGPRAFIVCFQPRVRSPWLCTRGATERGSPRTAARRSSLKATHRSDEDRPLPAERRVGRPRTWKGLLRKCEGGTQLAGDRGETIVAKAPVHARLDLLNRPASPTSAQRKLKRSVTSPQAATGTSSSRLQAHPPTRHGNFRTQAQSDSLLWSPRKAANFLRSWTTETDGSRLPPLASEPPTDAPRWTCLPSRRPDVDGLPDRSCG